MKILSSLQLKQADEHTIKSEGISSVDLMERAAGKCVDKLTEDLDPSSEVNIFCGLGNNGGDGLAIARLLHEKKFRVKVFIIRYSPSASPDFNRNEERMPKKVPVINIAGKEDLKKIVFESSCIIIDCLLGTGLNKPVDGILKDTIELINLSGEKIISIDLPSGLPSAGIPESDVVIKAAHTLTFNSPKLSFLFRENSRFVGEFSILDIVLDPSFIRNLNADYNFLTKADIVTILKPREKFSHKGTFGHALLIAGSKGKMGAAVLSAKACLRAGVGLLTVCVPGCGNDILQISVPEAMVNSGTAENYISGDLDPGRFDGIGIGPGIGTEKETGTSLKLLIQNCGKPLVLDADALNILSENKTWMAFLPKGSILTPHPKEFERLFGKTGTSAEMLSLQRDSSLKFGVYIVLKGAYSSISTPGGELWFNSTGNPGMATGGSGDVLTGILTGLLASGYKGLNAVALAVYLHGLAGDFAAAELGYESMLAGDIISHLGTAFNFLRQH